MITIVGLYFIEIIVITLWCCGFRKLVSSKEITQTLIDDTTTPPSIKQVKVRKEKMLLWKLGVFLESLGWWGKPLGACISCMPSVHGSLVFWLTSLYLVGFSPILIGLWVLVCVSAVFTSTYLYNRIEY